MTFLLVEDFDEYVYRKTRIFINYTDQCIGTKFLHILKGFVVESTDIPTLFREITLNNELNYLRMSYRFEKKSHFPIA